MKNYTGVHYNSLSVCVWVNNVIRCLSIRLSQIFTTIMLHSNSLVFTPHTQQKVGGMGTVLADKEGRNF